MSISTHLKLSVCFSILLYKGLQKWKPSPTRLYFLLRDTRFCICYIKPGFSGCSRLPPIFPLIRSKLKKYIEKQWIEIKHFSLNNPSVFKLSRHKKWNMNADRLFLNHAVLKVARRKRKEWSKNLSSTLWGQRQTFLWLCRVLEVCVPAFILFEYNLVYRISLLSLFWKKTFMGGYRVCISILRDCVYFSIIQVSRSHTYGIWAAFLHIICIYEF